MIIGICLYYRILLAYSFMKYYSAHNLGLNSCLTQFLINFENKPLRFYSLCVLTFILFLHLLRHISYNIYIWYVLVKILLQRSVNLEKNVWWFFFFFAICLLSWTLLFITCLFLSLSQKEKKSHCHLNIFLADLTSFLLWLVLLWYTL